MGLGNDVFDLSDLLTFLEQLPIRIVDELTYLLIINLLANAREKERGDHVSPVFLNQVRDEEFLVKTATAILTNLCLFTNMTGSDFSSQIIAHSLLIESANLHFGYALLLGAHRTEIGSHCRNWKVAQSERVVESDSQTVSIDVSMGHPIFVKELEQIEAFVVKENELFLSKDLLTAKAFLIKLISFLTCAGHGSI